jgi:predicted RNA-binding Zn-ribbon protein involved in translation (DUF1610 family)
MGAAVPEEYETRSAPCPQCLGEMVLSRNVPKFGAYPQLRTFQCDDCGHVVTIEVEE